MKLAPDITLVYQFGIFTITFFAVKGFIFDPVVKILKKRDELTVDAHKTSQKLLSETERLIEVYSEKIKEARYEGIQIKEELRLEGEKQANKILHETRTQLEAKAEQAKNELNEDTQKTRAQLKDISQNLSLEMAEKLLGRKVSS